MLPAASTEPVRIDAGTEPAPFDTALASLYDALWKHQMSPAIGKTAAR